MTRKNIWMTLTFLLFSSLLGAWSCDATPTVPLPPPDGVFEVSEPDANGIVTVTGTQHRNMVDGVALVFNDSVGRGIMVEVDLNGDFQAFIEADLGDVLYLQTKKDYRLSEEIERTVSSAKETSSD